MPIPRFRSTGGEEKLVVAGVMVGPNFSLMNGISLEQLPIEADSAQLA